MFKLGKKKWWKIRVFRVRRALCNVTLTPCQCCLVSVPRPLKTSPEPSFHLLFVGLLEVKWQDGDFICMRFWFCSYLSVGLLFRGRSRTLHPPNSLPLLLLLRPSYVMFIFLLLLLLPSRPLSQSQHWFWLTDKRLPELGWDWKGKGNHGGWGETMRAQGGLECVLFKRSDDALSLKWAPKSIMLMWQVSAIFNCSPKH